MRVATNAAAQNAIKKKLINRLEVSDAREKHYITESLYDHENICRNIYHDHNNVTFFSPSVVDYYCKVHRQMLDFSRMSLPVEDGSFLLGLL